MTQPATSNTKQRPVDYVPEVFANNGHGTSCSGPGCPTVEEALAVAFRDATYYILSCGYSAPTISVSAICHTCQGNGHVRIRRPRSTQTRKCPDCKSKAMQEVVPPFTAELHENCSRPGEKNRMAPTY